MPQMGTADVTYTRIDGDSWAMPSTPQAEYQFKVLFPNSTNVLYTSGGIPLQNAQLGCPAFLNKFIIEDMASSTGYVAKWDNVANTIRLYQNAAILTTVTTTPATISVAAGLTEVSTAATVSSTTLRVLVSGW